MAIELVCGKCQGRLLVETPGSVVACPHCGVHLQTAAPAADESTEVAAIIPPSGPAERDLIAGDSAKPSAGPGADVADFLQGGGFIDQDATRVDDGVSMPEEDESPAWATHPAEPAGSWKPAEEPAPFLGNDSDVTPPEGTEVPPPAASAASGPSAAAPPAAAADDSGTPPTAAPVDPSEVSTLPAGAVAAAALPVAAASASEKSPAAPGNRPAPNKPSSSGASGGPSPLAFKMLLSYASAVTVACLYLAYLLMTSASRSPCLNLPDVKDQESKGNKVTMLYHVDPIKPVFRWHRLKLGETRNYGPINVTPLRVTRGPLEFEFYRIDDGEGKGEIEETRRSSQPVLKLHLKIENVSENQEFAPLDRALVYTKESDPKNPRRFKANNFICSAEGRRKPDNFVWIYDLPPDSLWNVKNQNLDRDLKPHETMEAFIPSTEERIDSLSGDLIWRFHFRRGYNPETLRGVTSLIEVAFNAAEITDDPPLPALAPPDPPDAVEKPNAVEKTDGKS
jgi:hypothetical protein